MPAYAEMGTEELETLKHGLEREYAEIQAKGLSLNICLLYTSRCV